MQAYIFALVLFVFVAAFLWRLIRLDRKAHAAHAVRF